MDGSDGYCCFICLEDTPPLIRPCACRCLCCHQTCLALWQLQSAGKEEESKCRFCKQTLPSWKAAFSDCTGAAAPVMCIQYNGQVYWLEATPGDGGVEQFKENVRRLFNLSPEQPFDITFECRVPGSSNSNMELHGLHAYDAAVYCASLTAARRLSRSGSKQDSIDKGSPTWSNSSTAAHNTTRSRASSSSGSIAHSRSSYDSAAAGSSGRASSSSTNAAAASADTSSHRSSGPGEVDRTGAAHASAGEAHVLESRFVPSKSSTVGQARAVLRAAVAHALGYFRLLWQPPDELDEFC